MCESQKKAKIDAVIAHENDCYRTLEFLNEVFRQQVNGTKYQFTKLNPNQMLYVIELLLFMQDQIELFTGRIEEFGFYPEINQCGFTARIGMLDLYGEKLIDFLKIVSGFDCITVNGDKDDILISCSIRDAFVNTENL